MRVELLPLDPSFEAGVEIKVSEVPEDMGRTQRFQIAATHPARPGVVLRQPFTPPAGCNRSELINTATWINYLPESWRLIVNALWAAQAGGPGTRHRVGLAMTVIKALGD